MYSFFWEPNLDWNNDFINWMFLSLYWQISVYSNGSVSMNTSIYTEFLSCSTIIQLLNYGGLNLAQEWEILRYISLNLQVNGTRVAISWKSQESIWEKTEEAKGAPNRNSCEDIEATNQDCNVTETTTTTDIKERRHKSQEKNYEWEWWWRRRFHFKS